MPLGTANDTSTLPFQAEVIVGWLAWCSCTTNIFRPVFFARQNLRVPRPKIPFFLHFREVQFLPHCGLQLGQRLLQRHQFTGFSAFGFDVIVSPAIFF
jgi:hypothetical protein